MTNVVIIIYTVTPTFLIFISFVPSCLALPLYAKCPSVCGRLLCGEEARNPHEAAGPVWESSVAPISCKLRTIHTKLTAQTVQNRM